MYQWGGRPTQALPAGWQAKYDPSSRRWFYLNHVTKTTQWEDPRLSLQQTPPQQTRQPTAQPAVRQYQQKPQPITTSFIDADPAKVSTLTAAYGVDVELAKSLLRTHSNNMSSVEAALKEMGYKKTTTQATRQSYSTSFVEADPAKVHTLLSRYPITEALAKSTLRAHSNNVSSAESSLKDLGYSKKLEAKQHFVDLLKRQYPDAPIQEIKKQLVNSKNSVEGARLGLDVCGYKKASQSQSIEKLAATRERAAARSKEKLTSTSKTSTPKKEPVKVVDVAAAKRELKRKFPTLDNTTIELCLKVANNDVSMATKILEAKNEKDSKTAAARRSEEIKASVHEEPRKLEPVVFGSDEPPQISVSPLASTSYPTSSSSTVSSPQKASAPAVRQKQQYVPKTGYRQKTKTRAVARENEYKSSLRLQPVGPNPALCKGPDPSLLLKTYAERLGPNRANRTGSQAKKPSWARLVQLPWTCRSCCWSSCARSIILTCSSCELGRTTST